MSSERAVLEWRGGPYAVVWKSAGFPLEAVLAATSGDFSKGGSVKRGVPSPSSEASLCSWAQQHLQGSWIPRSVMNTGASGLVLLARPEVEHPGTLRGTYALVAMLQDVASQEGTEEETMKDMLELFGGPEDDARIVESFPSGHFGYLAVVELDVALSGSCAVSPLAAVLALQDLGFAVARLSAARSREVIDPRSRPQSNLQPDVLQGTCVEVVGIHTPAGVESSARHAKSRRPDGRVVRERPAKWSKFISVERNLALQRQQSADGVVEFRGLQLLVPSEQLKPRVSSGALVDAALETLRRRRSSDAEVRVLDLGVGCGALLLAILQRIGQASRGTGVDIDEGAVDVCRRNAERALAPEHAAKVKVVLADFGKLDVPETRSKLCAEGYDIIVCNPPYRSHAQQEAYDHASGQFGGYAENVKTLVAGETGLEMYEVVAACLARDMAGAQKRLFAPPAPLLQLGGTLIFQVEAGSFGRLGGAATRVAQAVEAASEGKLMVQGKHVDEKGLERAILVRHAGAD